MDTKIGLKKGLQGMPIKGIFTTMSWTVLIKKNALKRLPGLPEGVRNALKALMLDIEQSGPIRGNWPNYGKLGAGRHHCHIKKGKPAYVAVWEAKENKIKIVEVTYAGTHEKAPY